AAARARGFRSAPESGETGPPLCCGVAPQPAVDLDGAPRPRSGQTPGRLSDVNRSRLSPGVGGGGPGGPSTGDGFGLASARGAGGSEREVRQAAGECGGRLAEDGPRREGVAAAEAQSRSPRAELPDPPPQPTGSRLESHC